MQSFLYRVYEPGTEGDIGAGEIEGTHLFTTAVAALQKHSDVPEHAFGDFSMTIEFADDAGDALWTFKRCDHERALVICVKLQLVERTKWTNPGLEALAVKTTEGGGKLTVEPLSSVCHNTLRIRE